jgi:hypothetical protein
MQGMPHEELKELAEGLKLWSKLAEMKSQAFIAAVENVHGPNVAREMDDLMKVEGAAAEGQVQEAQQQAKTMGKMPDKPQ